MPSGPMWRPRSTAAARALLILCLSPAVPGQSAAPSPDSALTRRIASLLARPETSRAHWGIAVSSLDGRQIVSIDAGKLFHPASNAKLFTTAAAIALLGPEATITTRIEARGTIAAGTLTGDLALVGAGDANFATDDTPYQPAPRSTVPAGASPDAPAGKTAPLHALEAMADRIAEGGLHAVQGDIVGDDSALPWEPYPDDWAADDLLWGYGAPVSALSVHDNQIALTITPGSPTGLPVSATLEPGMPPWFTLDTTGLATGAAGSPLQVQVGPMPGGPRTLRLWGSVPARRADTAHPLEDTEQLALPDPALFAAETLRAMLLARGVTVSGIARAQHRLPIATASLRDQAKQPLLAATCAGDGCTTPGPDPIRTHTLATITSPTLLADETATNKLSLNLHAELLLQRLGQRFGAEFPATPAADPGSRAQGMCVLRSILPLAGIEEDDVVLVDGSGLSTHDLVTPRSLVQLLTWSATQPWFASWRSTLPIGGVDGTLAGRFRKPPLTGRVVAKTGTLGESRALSGYLTCTGGRVVAFSIMVDNHVPGSPADRDIMDSIVAALYAAL